MHLERRFGTSAGSMTLVLRNQNSQNITVMNDDYKPLGSYGIEDDFEIHFIDEDPNSIVRQLEDVSAIEKYVISNEDYDKLPSKLISERTKV